MEKKKIYRCPFSPHSVLVVLNLHVIPLPIYIFVLFYFRFFLIWTIFEVFSVCYNVVSVLPLLVFLFSVFFFFWLGILTHHRDQTHTPWIGR